MSDNREQRFAKDWSGFLSQCGQDIRVKSSQPASMSTEGRLRRVVGLTMEASGCEAPVGSRCRIAGQRGFIESKVVGFDGNYLFLMPVDHTRGLQAGARVIPSSKPFVTPVGHRLIGRVIDATGKPIDGLGDLVPGSQRPLYAESQNPLLKNPVNKPLDLGVRIVNALLPIGQGQRIGLFADSGVGKSQLLAMMTRNARADVVVIGLIGERGREVQTFVNDTLGDEGRKTSVVVAEPADSTSVRRIHGTEMACAIAEDFRQQGLNVLLLIDSLTRYAQAQRELGLAMGEPATTRAYPPSVFQAIPQLVERAGTHASGGSITAIYTLLTESDGQFDPVAESARAILDGHIVLSREIAEAGIYPAINPMSSISRLATELLDEPYLQSGMLIRQLYSTYLENRDLIQTGMYQAGSSSLTDLAIHAWPIIQDFIRQPRHLKVTREESLSLLLAMATEFAQSSEPAASAG